MKKILSKTCKISAMLVIFMSLLFGDLPLKSMHTGYASGTGTMYYFKCYDLTDYIDPETGQPSTALSMADYLALKLIQGVVNRDEPKLLIDQKLNYFTDCDAKWKEFYENKGYSFVTLNSMDDVYNTFKGYFNGVITYNHTFNTDTWHWPEAEMAVVLGALTNRIPILSSQVSRFQSQYGLNPADTVTLTDTFTDYYDAPGSVTGRLETLNWTTPLEAYQWGYDNLLKYCNPHAYHSLADESLDQTGEDKIFHTHLLSTNANELSLLWNIYAYLDARNETFPVWGWVAAEDADVHEMAAYGGYILTAGSTNLSFHNKFSSNLTNYTQSLHYTTENTTLENKYYIAFMASEPNTPKVITTFQHGAWLDSNRGNVPINWGFAPAMSEELPLLAEYYYSTATNNDYFYAGENMPLGFGDYDDMPSAAQNQVKTKGAVLMQKVDQRYLDLYSSYGAIGAFDTTEYGEMAQAIGAEAIVAKTPSLSDTETWASNTFVLNRPDMYPARQTDFSDTFSNASQWTAESGTWQIESGEYSQSNTNKTQRSSYASASTHSYVNAQVQIKKISSVNGSAGITFRKGTGANYYWFYLKDGNKAGLMKVVNGVKTVIGTEVDFNHTANMGYSLKVIAKGTSIKCYLNNQLIIDQTDATFASGKLGLATFACHAHFDNIKAVWTTQEQQLVNDIKSKTVNISKSKPYFLPAYYGYMFSGDYEKNQCGSEPGAGETMVMNPTSLKAVMDSLNVSYPDQFKFVRLDEMISAAKLYYGQTIQDDMNDFSKMYSHSANLYFDGSNPSVFNGDPSRLTRSANSEEYMIYNLNNGMNYFMVDSWFWPDEPITDFNFYTSQDNINYSLFIPSKTTENYGWTKVTYTGNSLPSGTRYLKIVFKHNTPNYWNPQIGSITIQSVSQSGLVNDPLDNWIKMYSHSANLYFDESSPSVFNGDSSRLTRSANSEEYIIYKAPANNILDFSVSTWFWPDEPITDFQFYTSPDNVTYSLVTTVKYISYYCWTSVVYDGSSLPINTKYLKIVFKQNTPNYWNPQIGSVIFDYGY